MNRYLFTIGVIFLICTFGGIVQPASAQSYGLGFTSHEAITDKRTTLDLFPQKGFQTSETFELSFDIAFLPNKLDYFGYVLRVIENGKRNFDLVYNSRDVSDNLKREPFKLVIGERYSNFDFKVPAQQLFHRWNNIHIKFDFQQHEVMLTVNGRQFRQPNINFKKESIYRMVFGVCKEANFKSSDCSAFKIRNVAIRSGNQQALKYFWPLNETSGNLVHETVSNSNGVVLNPVWMRAQHAIWRAEGSLFVKGYSSAAYNPVNENLFITGRDTLWSIAARGFAQTHTGYKQRFNLYPSNETIYNPYNGKLYNYYIEKAVKRVSIFDFRSNEWSPNTTLTPAIDYWQHNSFFCKSDSSLYVVGGYGRLTYKNSVWRYDLATEKWDEIHAGGSYYCPRYLAACGTTDNGNTAYFLGGYGSRTGEQMLNAKNLYDLVKFDVKTKTFKKLFDLKVSGQDFVFANTMVIDEKNRTYYTLIFSNQRFNSELTLLKGSLDNPSYQLIGSPIPFAFHDTHSFAKLFYQKSAQQFVVVTMNRPMTNDQDCSYRWFSLQSPPENLPAAAISTAIIRNQLSNWAVALIAITISALAYAFFRYRRKKVFELPVTAPAPVIVARSETAPIAEATERPQDHITSTVADLPIVKTGPTIHLFGNLTIHNEHGEDLSGNFTALVRELFLVILIYSIKSNRGITPEKLLELLWPDKSEDSARNNRAANLSKLRAILNHISQIRLSKDTRSYRLEIDYSVIYVDYWEYLQIINHRRNISKEQISRLISITSRGAFITGVNYHWLEQIKTDIANEVIDIYLASLNTIRPEEQSDFAIELANAIFVFDVLNEDAMIAKCKALYALGKHTLARSTFDAFNNEFRDLYGDNFKLDFMAIVNNLVVVR